MQKQNITATNKCIAQLQPYAQLQDKMFNKLKLLKILIYLVVPILVSSITILILIVCFLNTNNDNQIKNTMFEVEATKVEVERIKNQYECAMKQIKQLQIALEDIREQQLKYLSQSDEDDVYGRQITTKTIRKREASEAVSFIRSIRQDSRTNRPSHVNRRSHRMEDHTTNNDILPPDNKISKKNWGDHYYANHKENNGHFNFTHVEHLTNWARASWANHNFTKLDADGSIVIHEPGLYYIYAQVCYYHLQDECGYTIGKLSAGDTEPSIITACKLTDTLPPEAFISVDNSSRENTCFTAAFDKLAVGDRLSIRPEAGRTTIFLPHLSFFGLVKMFS